MKINERMAIRGLLAAIVLCRLGGCSTTEAIHAWRDYVEEYIEEQGNGDPNVLRNVEDDPANKGIGLLGAQRRGIAFFWPTRIDATGVLLGHRLFDERYWFVFLVGAVEYHGSVTDLALEDPRVVDVRLAALSVNGDAYHWIVSDRDPAAIRRYREPQERAWRESDPSRSDTTKPPSTFPADEDMCTLEIGDDAITAVEQRSGATWKLQNRNPN